MLSPGEQDAIPHVLLAWVRWAGARAGMPAGPLAATLDAVFDAMRAFPSAYHDPTSFGLEPALVARLLPDRDLEALPRRAFAFPLPFTVICELLGVPAPDRAPLGQGFTKLLVPTSTPAEYAAAKERLFTEVGPGAAVLNVDDAFGRDLAGRVRAPLVRVSARTDAGASAEIAPRDVQLEASGTRATPGLTGAALLPRGPASGSSPTQ